MEQLEMLQPLQRMKQITGAIVHPQPIAYATMGYPFNSGHNHTDSVYAFTVDEPPLHAPDEGESTDIRLFTRDEVTKESSVDSITHDIALYGFDEILGSWQAVSSSDFS